MLAELTRGVALVRRRNPIQAKQFERWLAEVRSEFRDRTVGADAAIAERWGEINAPDKLPTIDGFIAATALVFGMIVVTRNTIDFQRAGVQVLDPFQA
ncbi:PIN domain-containing protein [Chthonobacter albigriseus]|uniref:PIN domain-containing protein n=1 Tax=Chthonobacter albigriseus TaxID=1683161 RepID=UPI0015EF7363